MKIGTIGWPLAGAVMLLLAGRPAPAADTIEPIVTLHYYERPPFHARDAHGQITGLVADPAARILRQAGIAYTWRLTPANRILNTLKNNSGMDCSPGWYKTPERASYARFSLPIYQDRPLVGLSRADFAAPAGISARDLFGRPGTRLLVKQNFSQGAYMDALIAAVPPAQVQRVTVEVATMVKMVQAGRADLIVTTQEEAEIYIRQAGFQTRDFRVLRFPDVPAVEQRYLVCSKQVTAQVMARINKAIRGR